MPRTITVKGMGRVTTAPDYVVISMSLEAHEQDYEATMELAAKKIEQLNASLEEIGLRRKRLRLRTSMSVPTMRE